MPKVIQPGDLIPSATGSIKFEGEKHGSEISFFLVNSAPGAAGPPLHRHPYSETWIVRAGRGNFIAGDLETEAGAGAILVTEANVPHKFRNIGETTLELTCIHASPHMIQENLE